MIAGPSAASVRLRATDGADREPEAVAANLLGDPRLAGIVVNSRDIAEREAFETQRADRAPHDATTGFPNRALVLGRVAPAPATADRQPAPPGVILLGLDRFGHVNGRFRRAGGDAVLAAGVEAFAPRGGNNVGVRDRARTVGRGVLGRRTSPVADAAREQDPPRPADVAGVPVLRCRADHGKRSVPSSTGTAAPPTRIAAGSPLDVSTAMWTKLWRPILAPCSLTMRTAAPSAAGEAKPWRTR